MKHFIMLSVLLALTACGGSPRSGGSGATITTGPMASACNASDRDASNRALCSCVQRVANTHLSSADQSRAVGFFRDPQLAQDARTADDSRTEAFWRRYRAFLTDSENSCG